MTDRLVLVVGAGPTGLVLALWLTRHGASTGGQAWRTGPPHRATR